MSYDYGKTRYHEGQSGPNCQYENKLSNFGEMDLNSCGGRQVP